MPLFFGRRRIRSGRDLVREFHGKRMVGIGTGSLMTNWRHSPKYFTGLQRRLGWYKFLLILLL